MNNLHEISLIQIDTHTILIKVKLNTSLIQEHQLSDLQIIEKTLLNICVQASDIDFPQMFRAIVFDNVFDISKADLIDVMMGSCCPQLEPMVSPADSVPCLIQILLVTNNADIKQVLNVVHLLCDIHWTAVNLQSDFQYWWLLLLNQNCVNISDEVNSLVTIDCNLN